MAFDAGAVIGEAVLETAKWSSGIGVVEKSSKFVGGILKTALAAGFAAVTTGMAASVYQANEYQKEFSNVSTLTNQNTASLQKMSMGLLSLDSELGTTRELTRSMYDAISAGANPGAEALETVASSAKFAKAAVADNAASVKLLAATQNAYGREVITSDQAADVFFTTIKQGVVTGEELASTIGQSIPLFASMNIPVEQLGAGMAAMTKQGVSASESTTQLNAIVSSFLKPSETLAENIARAGYESGEAFITAEGLTGAMKLLTEATESGDAQMAELLPNIRGMRGAMALSGQGAIEFQKTLDEMANSAGVVDEAFGKQEKTFATFKAELGKTSIIVGNIGKFFVDDIAKGAQEALESINQFLTTGDGLKTLSEIAGNVAGGFSTIVEIGKTLYEQISGSLFESVEEIKTSFGELFGDTVKGIIIFDVFSKALNLVSATLNVAVKAAAVIIQNFMALVKVGVEATKVLSSFWQVLTGEASISEVKATLSEAGKAVENLGSTYVKGITKIVEEGKEQWDAFGDNAEENSERFAQTWKKGSENAKAFVQTNYVAAVSGVKSGNDSIQSDTEDTQGAIQKELEDTTAATTTELVKQESAYQKFFNAIEGKFGTVFDNVHSIVSSTFSSLTDIADQFRENEMAEMELSHIAESEAMQSKYESDLAALQKSYDDGLISQADFDTQSEALTAAHDAETKALDIKQKEEKNKIAKKQFDADKKTSIAQVWLDHFATVAGFWRSVASIPFPGNVIAGASLSGTALGIAIAQTVGINKQQFVPAFAEGTDYAPGGLSLVGEEGPELMEVKRGSRILPANITSDIMKGGGESNSPTINVNHPTVRDDRDIGKITRGVSQILGRQMRFV